MHRRCPARPPRTDACGCLGTPLPRGLRRRSRRRARRQWHLCQRPVLAVVPVVALVAATTAMRPAHWRALFSVLADHPCHPSRCEHHLLAVTPRRTASATPAASAVMHRDRTAACLCTCSARATTGARHRQAPWAHPGRHRILRKLPLPSGRRRHLCLAGRGRRKRPPRHKHAASHH